MMHPLVTVEWLETHLEDQDLIILDASLEKTAEGNPPEHANLHIPGSRFFDLENKFSDKSSPFPHTLPTAASFQKECRKLGINESSKIVVYDAMGIYSSARIWWMFHAMGHGEIAVLDGGLPAWVRKGLSTTQHFEQPVLEGDFKATLQKGYLYSYEDVLNNITNPSFTVIDARGKGRFDGTAPEPRKWLKSGSIPHSLNVPFKDVLQDGFFKNPEELQEIFQAVCPHDNTLVFSCGSGMTACITLLASRIAGRHATGIYDGSWTEWAERQNLKTGQ